MGTLRKVLFIHAAVWGVLGVAMMVAPASFVHLLSSDTLIVFTSFRAGGFVPSIGPIDTFARIIGSSLLVIAMFMVLVAQKIEAVWWWSWAFVFGDLLVTLIATTHAAFGVSNGASSLPWWIVTVVSVAFAIALLWGLFKAQQDQPIIEA
jgi:hypothetical protein